MCNNSKFKKFVHKDRKKQDKSKIEFFFGHEYGVVRDFFSNKVTQKGAYDLKVSGWEQYVAEHLYFLKHQLK